MAKTNLYFKSKLKFLKSVYTNADTYARNVREYIDRAIPNRLRSISNLFNLTIDVTQDISTLHLLNQETAENELNVFTAQNESNIRGIAQISGHNPTLPISARGSVRLSVSKQGLQDFGRRVSLSDKAVFKCLKNGLEYILQREQSIMIDTSTSYMFIPLVEGKRKSQTFVVDGNDNLVGRKLYTINLDDSAHIEHYDIKVYVNNELWSKVDSLRDMTSNSNTYIKRIGYGNQIDITFGNGISGKRLSQGDTIRIEYLLTNGEFGNVGTESVFEIMSGLTDIQGNEINAKQYLTIVSESGFDLGSDGEDKETTRAMCGFSSRSLSFARPEYMRSYLSRLSILSHVNAWTEQDSLVFNIMALPKIVLSSPKEYLTISENKFKLTDKQKKSIKTMLDASKRQWVSTEIVFKDPIIKKYAMYVFIDNSVIYDKLELKSRIESKVSEIMLSKTFGEVDKDASNDIISRSDFVNALYDMSDINAVSIDIVSEENESSRINKYYYKTEMVMEGAVKVKKVTKVTVADGENFGLGLSEIGDIVTKQDEIPVLRGGFKVYQTATTSETLPTKGVIIFVKENNEWVSL